MSAGASIPSEAMMHSALFQISPLFSKKCSDSAENFHNFTFSRKFFLVIDHKFRIFPPINQISPLFSLLQYISPLFRENYYFPLLFQMSPLFSLDFLMCISSLLSVILDLFLILSSLYLIMSTVSLVLVSTTYANFVSSTNLSLACHHDIGACFGLHQVGYGNTVYIGLFSADASKLQSVLSAAACLVGGIPKFFHISSFI